MQNKKALFTVLFMRCIPELNALASRFPRRFLWHQLRSVAKLGMSDFLKEKQVGIQKSNSMFLY